MKGSKRIRRLVLFQESSFDRMESWLESMAQRGWRLVSISNAFATFERSEPVQLRYRVDVDVASTLDLGQRDELYASAGWKRMGSRSQTSVYCAEDPAAPELHTEPYEFANVLVSLQRNSVLQFVAYLFVICSAAFPIFAGVHMRPQFMLDPYMIAALFAVMSFLIIVIIDSANSIHLKRFTSALRKGIWPIRKSSFHAFRRVQGTFMTVVFLMLTVYLFSDVASIFCLSRHQPPATGSLPVVRMTDIPGQNTFQPSESNNDEYYKTGWSPLVPSQYELMETDSNSSLLTASGDANSVRLTSQRYEALTVPLAQYLARTIAEDSGNVRRAGGDSGFDDLWTYDTESGMAHEVVAREGRVVFHIIYYGKGNSAQLVSLLAQRK